MTYQNYRKMDLSFFALIGMISVLISEGAFILMPDVQFRISLLLLVGFIAGIRWGKFAFIPYFLSMMLLLIFNDLYKDSIIWIPYYLISSIGFVIPIELFRKYLSGYENNLFKVIGVFISAFLSQAVFSSLFVMIIDGVNFFGFLIDYVAVNLLTITMVLLFIIVLFKASNALFKNMDVYLKQVQEEQEEDV
ncbi:hypothetical protein [Acholeplasma granularum]|uniref:hypothetical protein n=1 Tax=Acholeplasma granularum TaxID=264635 RepID=UPI0004721D84|nr:hypothetical protein [Acholeplasma granularum]